MKKVKRGLGILLSLAVLAGVMGIAGVSAQAEAKVFVAEAADSDLAWTSTQNATISVDARNKIQGDASIRVEMPETGEFIASVFAMQLHLDYTEPVDLNEWDYFEMCVNTEGEFKYDPVLQTNFVDGDVQASDGFNTGYIMYERFYHDENGDKLDPENYWDVFKEDGWVRFNYTRDDILAADVGLGASPQNITKMRLSLLYYSNENWDKIDFNFDGLIFYNEEFLTARTAAETEMAAKIEAAAVPTKDTIESLKDATLALITEYEAKCDEYQNFMPENFLKYYEIRDAYYDCFKDETVANAKAVIDAIGEITIENYTEKEDEIAAAEAAVAELNSLYGEGNYTLENKDVVSAAKKAVKNCEKAANAIAKINAIPEIDVLTLENKEAIEDARKTFDRLSDDQEAYVPKAVADKLVAAEAKIYELENPYVLGNVDEDEEDKITASDALLTLQAAVNKIELSELQAKAAEVDGKEKITAGDALCILQYAVGKIDTFPIQIAED